MLYIRKYQEADTDELWELFYNTVHRVNIKDYSKSQVDAWASKDIGINRPLAKVRIAHISSS